MGKSRYATESTSPRAESEHIVRRRFMNLPAGSKPRQVGQAFAATGSEHEGSSCRDPNPNRQGKDGGSSSGGGAAIGSASIAAVVLLRMTAIITPTTRPPLFCVRTMI